MMARTLEGDDIDHIELDDLLLTKDHFTMDELKDYSEMLYCFFNGEGAKYYIGVEERDSIPKEEYEDKDTVQDRKQMFGRETRNYLLDEDKINKYREYFGDRPDTVFREEQDESAIIKALNGIDKCFVNEDANGLLEIMKNAKASNLLSGPEKQMVAHECKAAALDMFA